MKRRNFFAALMAPVLAWFLPKPKKEYFVVVPAECKVFIKPGSLDEIAQTQKELAELMIRYYTTDRRMKILGPEGLDPSDV